MLFIMTRFSRLTVPLALTLTLFLGSDALAQDEPAKDKWKFAIGTGFATFSLNGDIGFPASGGGMIFRRRPQQQRHAGPPPIWSRPRGLCRERQV